MGFLEMSVRIQAGWMDGFLQFMDETTRRKES